MRSIRLRRRISCPRVEAVPGRQAWDVGLDRTMIGGYGQDDSVCDFAGCESDHGH
jgi:aspartyl aminopeptidase